MTTDALYSIYLSHPAISTDTRSIIPGSLFFALKGERFNGNAFAASALEAGAAYAVIDEEKYRLNDRCILVNNALSTLQDLARHHRLQLGIPVIGITGTNGKTTTKELIASVLGTRFSTHATRGNLNNHIGVPLTLLSIPRDTRMAVIEMGANHQGEIGFLCSICMPTHGLITNVGKAHLEGFDGFEGVKKGKGELYRFLADTGGTVFVNAASADLREMLQQAAAAHTITYHGEGAAVDGKLLQSDPLLTLEWREAAGGGSYKTGSNLTGTYNLDNILAAICIGRHFGLNPEEINRGISSYIPTNNRSQLMDTGRNRLICDYYNANPSSMAVALDNLGALTADKKALILGDMFELGGDAAAEHRSVFAKAMSVAAGRRIFIGNEFYRLSPGNHTPGVSFYPSATEAIAALQQEPLDGYTVLLKGSRSMKLETLIPCL
jgi:UDP-N-acetylmuramoyl-tripeptide--D-alanyl-D-alanine ligase